MGIFRDNHKNINLDTVDCDDTSESGLHWFNKNKFDSGFGGGELGKPRNEDRIRKERITLSNTISQ